MLDFPSFLYNSGTIEVLYLNSDDLFSNPLAPLGEAAIALMRAAVREQVHR